MGRGVQVRSSLTIVFPFWLLFFSDHLEVYGAVHWQRDQIQVHTYLQWGWLHWDFNPHKGRNWGLMYDVRSVLLLRLVIVSVGEEITYYGICRILMDCFSLSIFSGVFSSFVTIYREEGIFGFFAWVLFTVCFYHFFDAMKASAGIMWDFLRMSTICHCILY